jgi:hypothetical protein
MLWELIQVNNDWEIRPTKHQFIHQEQAMTENWAADVRKYVPNDADEKAIAGIVRSACRIGPSQAITSSGWRDPMLTCVKIEKGARTHPLLPLRGCTHGFPRATRRSSRGWRGCAHAPASSPGCKYPGESSMAGPQRIE